LTTFALAVGALLAVACALYVALPFLREPAPRSDRLDEPDAPERRRLELAEERDRALAALKELEFDHRTGKVSDDDYRELVGPLRRQAAEALRALGPRAEAQEGEKRVRAAGYRAHGSARIEAKEAEMTKVAEQTQERIERAPLQVQPTQVAPGGDETPDEAPEPARVPEPFPPPDEGDRPQQPTIPEPVPGGPPQE